MKTLLCGILCAGASLFSFSSNAEEIFYLKERVSVTTDTGIVNLLPGTKVTQVGKGSDSVTVKSDDGRECKVKKSQLTADAKEGEQIAQADANSRSAAEAARAQANAAIAAAEEKKRQDARQNAENAMKLINQQSVTSSPPASAPTGGGLTGTSMDSGGTPTSFTMHPRKKVTTTSTKKK
jgi:regulator of protease activity HflC (stomatin/prohibitin superfamily)